MSFLNALASDGLSVGLRFYNAKLNSNRPVQPLESGSASGCETEASAAASPAITGRAEASPKSVRPPEVLTAEEIAAGRADARARLAEDGSLGLLQAAAAPEKTAYSASEPAPGLLTDDEKLEAARLQAHEEQIKAEVTASVQQGVPGADSVKYSYTTGPDGQRYISGIEGGGGGAAPAAAKEGDTSKTAGFGKELNTEEERQVQEMRDRDREVRAHEQAHVAAAAGLAGAPVYEYQTGPDGKRYAVGGHVDLKTGGHSDPEKALQEAEIIKRAAMAPASPSGPDLAAAAKASADANRLRAEKTSGPEEEGRNGRVEDSAKNEKSSFKTVAGPSGAEKAAIYNGASLGQQVIGAYSAAKFGASQNIRTVLARA